MKIYLTHALEQTDFADDPYLEGVLRSYFPVYWSSVWSALWTPHPLRKEIICTRVATELVNIGGITFAYRVMEEFNVGIDSVARAFIVARELFERTQLSCNANCPRRPCWMHGSPFCATTSAFWIVLSAGSSPSVAYW